MKKFFVCTLIVFAFMFSTYANGEEVDLMGIPIEENELDDVHGGFVNANGNFVYFAMDYMKVKFVASDSGATGAAGSNVLSSLQQNTTVSEDGMGVELQIVNGGLPEGFETDGAAQQISSTQVSIADNVGFVNANIVNGNNNTAAITNVINIQVGFFEVKDSASIESTVRDWLFPMQN